MRLDRRVLKIFFHWAAFCLSIGLVLVASRFVEAQLDNLSYYVCPSSWWHKGLLWRHCAYPVISIAKYGVDYAILGVALLAVIHFVAPSHRRTMSYSLLLLLLAYPAAQLLFVKFSWTMTTMLIVAFCLALVYGLGVRAAHNMPSQDTAPGGP